MTAEARLDSNSTTAQPDSDGHVAKLYDAAYGTPQKDKSNEERSKKADAETSAPKPQESLLERAGDWVSGAADVTAQVVSGAAVTAYDAIKDHPLDTAVKLAEGAAIGVAVIAAAPVLASIGASAGVVAGAAMVADAALVVMTAAGVATAGADGMSAAKDSADFADVLMHKSEHTQEEVDTARNAIQTRTGGAALEAAGAAAMVLGTFGSLAKTEPFALPNLTLTGLEKSRGTARPVPATGQTESTGQLMAASRPEISDAPKIRPTSSPEKYAGQGEHLNIPPEAAVLRLSDRIATYIGKRNEKVEAPQLVARKTELEEQQIKWMDVAREIKAPDGYSKMVGIKLRDTERMSGVVKEFPEIAEKYQEYLSNRLEFGQVSEQLDKELQLRRHDLAKMLTVERQNLFPGEVLPPLKVEQLAPESKSFAGYSGGAIYLRDHALIDGDLMHVAFNGDKTTELILHEMKHAEQDGLMIRRNIDTVTGGDSSGRSLTKKEIEEIADTSFGKRDSDVEAMIKDVNKQRAGRVLTAEELTRAERLEDSKIQNVIADHSYTQEHFDWLKSEYQYHFQSDLSWGGTTSSSLLDDDSFESMFTRENPELRALKREYDQAPRDEQNHPIYDADFEKKAAPIIKRALRDEIERTQKFVQEDYADYRDYLHEREAWGVSDAVSNFLPEGNVDVERQLLEAIFSTFAPR